MKISTSVIALAIAGLFVAVPASAQYNQLPTRGADADPANKTEASRLGKKDKEETQTTAPKSTDGRKLKISPQAQKAIVALQTAVNANDTTGVPSKLAEAQKVAKSPDEKFFVAVNQVKFAMTNNDLPGIRVGLEAMEASGAAETPDLVARYNYLGKRHYDAKQVDQAAAAFERSVALGAGNPDALKFLASTRDLQGKKAEAVALMQRSIAASKAAGLPVKENEYKFAVGIAHSNKLPVAAQAARDWVSAYPTAQNWHDALRVYRDVANPKGEMFIDHMRLAQAAGGLSTVPEYYNFAMALFEAGETAEAKAVLAEGQTKGVNAPEIRDLVSRLTKVPTRAEIDASAKAALAGSSAKAAVDAGDVYYGIGAFAEAAALYKAAAGKAGADLNTVNLRLGAALARSGDKAGATAALNAAGGAQAELAKYWQVWLAARG